MWNINEIKRTETTVTFQILEEGKKAPITYRDFFDLLTTSPDFRSFYNNYLSKADFEAFFWENKPITTKNMDQDYECTLVKSDHLDNVAPDSQTFNSYFRSDKAVVTFPNLGEDAKLIAPCPAADHSTYAQIGNFVRNAPESQIQEFWKTIGKEMMDSMGSEPRWLSTSGLGVYWLHVRIDSYPKYYQTQSYKSL